MTPNNQGRPCASGPTESTVSKTIVALRPVSLVAVDMTVCPRSQTSYRGIGVFRQIPIIGGGCLVTLWVTAKLVHVPSASRPESQINWWHDEGSGHTALCVVNLTMPNTELVRVGKNMWRWILSEYGVEMNYSKCGLLA